MKVLVKLFANLRTDRAKEQYMEVEKMTTPMDIIKVLEIPISDVSIIMINGKRAKLESELEENDVLAIFPPVGGG